MKIFVSDYDGTLNRGGGVTPRDLAALAAWKAAGNLFGVATGRDFKSFANVWGKTLLTPDFVVGGNGTQIYNGVGNRLLEFPGDGSLIPAVAELILAHDGRIVHFTSGAQRYIVALDGKFPEQTKDIYVLRDAIPELPKVHSINTYFHGEDLCRAFCEDCNERFAGKFTALQNCDCGDVVPFGTGKKEGIAAYIEYAGLAPEEIVTAGDSGNDLDMLRAYEGYTVESASDWVKAAMGDRVRPDLAAMIEEHL